MKEIFENKKVLFFAIGFVVILIILIGALALGGGGLSPIQTENGGLTSIEAQKNGSDDKLVVYSDGRVEVHRGGQVFTDFWAKGKTTALFAYYNDFYSESGEINGQKASFTYDDDELIRSIIEGTVGGGGNNTGGNGSSNPGQDIDDLFNTPSPSSPGSSGSGRTPRPSPTPTTPEKEPWCLYWRLSYCVIAYQTPGPSGSSPTPGANILPPTCPENTLTGRTVIGDELCFTTPTPLPTP